MTQEEQKAIWEGNRLIAEFMGGREYIHKTHFKDWMREEAELIGIEDLRFNTSWDWLMPVIEKIARTSITDSTEKQDVHYPRTFGMPNAETGNPMVRFNCCQVIEAKTLIEAAWYAVIDFITPKPTTK